MSLLLEKTASVIKSLLAIHAEKVRRESRRVMLKEASTRVHLRQVKKIEAVLEDTLETLFIRQIKASSRELASLAPNQNKAATNQTAIGLASQIFNPKDWDDELVDRVFPVLAQGMIEAANAQLMLMGVKIKKRKASTATEYLETIGLSAALLSDVEFLVPVGASAELAAVSLNVATEFPDWMLRSIQDRLQESFAQDYWTKVNQTTLGDIEQYLEMGLRDGWSIDRMAKEMAKNLLEDGEYAMIRGRRIARTESGNALNGARSAAIDNVIQETGTEGQIQKVWLSVLGDTTRETHANLDGVPADKNGEWLLGGVRCRWPGDVRLTPEERINCQCSILSEFGLQDAYAEQLIQEYQQRYDEWASAEGKAFRGTKVFCPTGPGGGVDPTCSPGGGRVYAKDAYGKYVPGIVGKASGVDTSKWKKDSTNSQWALKKIHTLEKLAADGDWDGFNKSMSKATGKLTTYQKAVIKAQENLLKMKAEKIKQPVENTITPKPPANSEWTKIGPKLGTENGGTYEFGGKKFYVKIPDDANRAHNEILALKLYELAGAGAVKGHLVEIDGKKSVATEWLEGSEKLKWTAGDKVAAADDFAVHAWLNNRDAVGAGTENPKDNIRLHDGQLKLVDAGGALDYKGMGGSGKKDFSAIASEYTTMRDPAKNPSMAEVFGSMTPQQLVASTKKLESISNAQIKDLVNQYHGGTAAQKQHMADTLIARKDGLVNNGKALKLSLSQDGASSAVKPAAVSKSMGVASIPPPPHIASKSGASYQNKMNKIYEAAKKGDVSAIEAIKTKHDPKHTYTNKAHQYKMEVLAAMKSGGKVSDEHITPPVSASKIKIDEGSFPTKPSFSSKNAGNVIQNNAKVEEALKYAKEGDIESLKSMELPPSTKLKSWHGTLVGNVADQLNPPPPPRKISKTLEEISNKVTNVKGDGLKKIGHWIVAGDVGGVPEGVGAGKWLSGAAEKESLWQAGSEASLNSGALGELRSYTGSGYHGMNASLRGGHASSSALTAANAIMQHGVEIPAGTLLSRKHGIAIGDLAPGQVVVDRGILSTSISNKWHGNVQWNMTVSPGVKGIPVKKISYHPGEDEVLLPPNQRILVTKFTKKGSETFVDAVILPTLDSQCCPP